MTVLARKFAFELKYMGAGSRLTLRKGTVTVTVIGSPLFNVLGSVEAPLLLRTATDPPKMPAAVKYDWTAEVTEEIVLPSRTATRAPSLEALVKTC